MKFLEFSRVQATALLLTVTVGVGTAGAAGVRVRAAAATGWANTATRGLAGKLVSATDYGAVNPALPMHVEIGLTVNKSAMDSALAAMYAPASAQYHHFLAPGQFAQYFAPSQAQANAVASYLVSAGLKNVVIEDNRLTISAYGTAAVMQSAFNTTIHNYSQTLLDYKVPSTRAIFANTTPAQVPAALASSVTSVIGLNSIGMHTFARKASVAGAKRSLARFFNGNMHRDVSPCLTGSTVPVCVLNTYYPTDLAIAYDGAGAATASKEHIGIFTEGDLTQTKADLAQALAADGQAPIKVKEKDVLGPATDTSGTDEWDIDSQSSTAMSGGVKSVVFYNGTSLQDDSITATFAKFAANDDVPLANASFGGCESLDEVEGGLATDDVILEETAMQGQTVFASSGDAGSQCSVLVNAGAPVGLPGVEYPGSSPYVTSVGGTSLLTNTATGTYFGEITWENGGGGISLFEQASPWQKSSIALAATTLRLVPDLANDADPNVSGMNTVVSGAYAGYGGTSLASPMTMGVYARLEQLKGNTLGEAAETLYADYDKVTGNTMGVLPVNPSATALSPAFGGFNDVIVGSNTAYQATPGFDLTTGMGTLDIARILKDYGG